MYAKSTRPSAKREVQEERSAKRDDQIARPRRAQTCERSELRAMRMCPRSRQIFYIIFSYKNIFNFENELLGCSVWSIDLTGSSFQWDEPRWQLGC